MFIGLFSKLAGDKNEPYVDYYDANRIIKVANNETGEGCVFWFDDGCADGASAYEAPSYDCGGLIELIMQARMRPAEMLPSLYVGKRSKDDDQPNNHQFRAGDKKA